MFPRRREFDLKKKSKQIATKSNIQKTCGETIPSVSPEKYYSGCG